MPGKGRPPQAIPSPISRHIITCYVRYQGSKHTVIFILVQTIMSVQAKLEVVRRKHIVHLAGFGAFSSTWLFWMDHMCHIQIFKVFLRYALEKSNGYGQDQVTDLCKIVFIDYGTVEVVTRTKPRSSGGNTLPIPQVSVPIPLPVIKGQTTVPAPWESISSHPPRSGCRHSTMPATTNALRDILPP